MRGALLRDPDGQDSILVLFVEGNTDLADTVILPTSQTIAHILVVGLDPNKHYSTDLDLSQDQLTLSPSPPVVESQVDSGTLVASDQGILHYEVQ